MPHGKKKTPAKKVELAYPNPIPPAQQVIEQLPINPASVATNGGMDPYASQQRRQRLSPTDLMRAYGDSGSHRFSGFYFDEYSPEWQNRERFEIVEQMRRGDAQAKASLRAIKAPILGVKWDIKSPTDDPEDMEIAEKLKQNLFNLPYRTWSEFLREALTLLDFGHSVFEIIWKISPDGTIMIKDLAPRLQRSILRWRTSEGDFGIQQILLTDEAKIVMPEVPAEKLVIFTNEKEGDDVTGISVLRAAWKHWDLKNILYKIQAMSAERFGVGVPTFTPVDGKGDVSAADMGDATKAACEEIGANLRANEASNVVLPGGVKFEIMTPTSTGSTSDAIQKAIDHHGKQIYASVLADFLDLGGAGGKSGGSNALSKDKSDFFMKSLNEVTNYLAEQLERQIGRKWVEINYGPRKNYPKFTHSPVNDTDAAALATSLNELVTAGAVDIDADMKKYIRDAFEFPAITPEQDEANREADQERILIALESGAPAAPTEAK